MQNRRLLSLALLIGSAPLWAEASWDERRAEARAMGKIACSMAGSDVRASADETTGLLASCKDGELHTLVRREPDGEVHLTVMGQDTIVSVLPDGEVVAGKLGGADGENLSIRLSLDGSVKVLPIVNKASHGASIIRFLNGAVFITPHVEGTENGVFVSHDPDGMVMVTPLVDGEPHGRAVIRLPDGEVRMHEFVMGEPAGEAITHPALKSAPTADDLIRELRSHPLDQERSEQRSR